MSEYESRSKRRRLKYRPDKDAIFDRRGSKTLDQLWGRGRDIPETPDDGHQCAMHPESCQRR